MYEDEDEYEESGTRAVFCVGGAAGGDVRFYLEVLARKTILQYLSEWSGRGWEVRKKAAAGLKMERKGRENPARRRQRRLHEKKEREKKKYDTEDVARELECVLKKHVHTHK